LASAAVLFNIAYKVTQMFTGTVENRVGCNYGRTDRYTDIH